MAIISSVIHISYQSFVRPGDHDLDLKMPRLVSNCVPNLNFQQLSIFESGTGIGQMDQQKGSNS